MRPKQRCEAFGTSMYVLAAEQSAHEQEETRLMLEAVLARVDPEDQWSDSEARKRQHGHAN